MILMRSLYGRTLLTMIVSIVLLLLSAFLMVEHVQSVRAMRESNVPLAASITALRAEEQLLKSQLDVHEVQDALLAGSAEEVVQASVLTPDARKRVLSAIETSRNSLEQKHQLRSMKPVSVLDDDRLSIEATLTQDGRDAFLAFMFFMGTYTVSDLLSDDERAALLDASKTTSPAVINRLSRFLSLDVSVYAQDADAYEDQVVTAFPADQRVAIAAVLKSPVLAQVESFLSSDTGKALIEAKLWPLPVADMQAVHITRDGEWWTVAIVLRLVSGDQE